MAKIIDEFTDLPISRERKRQLRRVRDGICAIGACREKLLIGERCLKHYIKVNDYQREAKGCKLQSVNTKAHRQAAKMGLGEFYLDKSYRKQFRWTDRRILRLLRNGKH